MAEVHRFKTVADQCADDAERVLLSWLEQVRAGDIVGIGIVGATNDGTYTHECSDCQHGSQIIAGLEALKVRIIMDED